MDVRSHAASFIWCLLQSMAGRSMSSSGHHGQAMAGSSIFCDIASPQPIKNRHVNKMAQHNHYESCNGCESLATGYRIGAQPTKLCGQEVGIGCHNQWHGDTCSFPDIVIRPYQGHSLHVIICLFILLLITNQDIGTSAKWLNLTSTIALLQDRLTLNHNPRI